MKPGTRLRRNVQRIDHLVFMYNTRERLDDTRAKMNLVLGLDEEDWDEPLVTSPPMRCTTQLCWGAGLELICPAPGDEGREWFGAPILAERGEGISMVAFGVADMLEANRRANAAGFPVIQTLQDPRHPVADEERPEGETLWEFPEELRRPFQVIRESMIRSFNGTGLYFCQIEPKAELDGDADVAAVRNTVVQTEA